ncbi:uncharacterized protein LOC62_04G005248 [Vanrija pseudolonga]|uniref:Uncharacterized protein n=1 Tax=Vanrija pseudolonga TaxID=143232 RepID=A0AAF0Y884_9TREE|nr:hypothetical protein LOC62_04G005248 [Vanrija pseudolonga]
MESILQHLPPDQLLPLRALSRGMYRVVGRLIKSYQVTLVDHRWRCKHRCSPPWGVRTTPHSGEGAAHCLQDLPVRGLLPKVLLVNGGGGEHLVALLAHMDTVHTIQRTSPSAILGNFPTRLPAGISTLVDYLELGKLGGPTVPHRIVGSERMVVSSRSPRKRAYDTAALVMSALAPPPLPSEKYEIYDVECYHHVVVPPPIRRYVIHVSFHQWLGRKEHHEPTPDIRFQISDGATVVFVLWPHFFTGEAHSSSWAKRPFPKVPRSVICVLWAAAADALSGGTPTLVNADRLSPILFRIDKAHTDDPAEVLNKVKRILRLQLDCMLSNALGRPVGASNYRVAEAFRRIRFLTLEEWWAELGPIRRQYEGLALGGEHAGKHESYSLKLVELYVVRGVLI